MFDAASQLKRLLTEVQGLNASNVAPLCDISIAQISMYLSGKKPVALEDSQKIDNLCRFVRDIEAAFSPAPLNWKNTAAIKKIKEGFENGELYVRVIQNSETQKPHRSSAAHSRKFGLIPNKKENSKRRQTAGKRKSRMSVRVVEEGSAFEERYMAMVARFHGAGGVGGYDVEAALLLEANRDSRLDDLLARRIHVVNAEIDELTDVEDLVFTKGDE